MMDRPTHPIPQAVLTKRIAALPALPALTTDLLASFDQEDLDVSTLARRISADQSLLARMLRIANSPFYGLSGKVGTIGDAIVVLGFRTVRSLALSAAMVDSLSRLGNQGIDAGAFWRHSVGTALCARQIALALRGNAETAFTAGLIHDMGQLLLAACFPGQYTEILKWRNSHDCPTRVAERAVIGTDHAVVGGLIAHQWNFPPAIADAIVRHPVPDDGPPARLTDIVHFANALALALTPAETAPVALPPLSSMAWERLGLKQTDLGPILRKVENDFEETCRALTT